MSGSRQASGPCSHKLTVEEVPTAVDVLVRAFDRDPFVRWVVRSDQGSGKGMQLFFNVTLRQLTMPFGEVWISGDMHGVAMWTPPGRFKVGPRQQAGFLWHAVGAMGLRNVPSRLAAFNVVERCHPNEPHYYLFFMGIDPDHQGQGIGSLMLQEMLERCDAEGLPAYLEATHEGLLPFYAAHGFLQRAPMVLGDQAPTLLPMWRDPVR